MATRYFLLFTLFISTLVLSAQKHGTLTIKADSAVAALNEKFIVNAPEQKLDGYRIQIYNGNRSTCLQKRSDFLRKFPNITPYTLYESPEYRVQVGDFRTRLEADKYLRKVLPLFPGSFVLKTKIKWPELDAIEIEMED